MRKICSILFVLVSESSDFIRIYPKPKFKSDHIYNCDPNLNLTLFQSQFCAANAEYIAKHTIYFTLLWVTSWAPITCNWTILCATYILLYWSISRIFLSDLETLPLKRFWSPATKDWLSTYRFLRGVFYIFEWRLMLLGCRKSDFQRDVTLHERFAESNVLYMQNKTLYSGSTNELKATTIPLSNS